MTMKCLGQYSAKAFLQIPTSVVRHECIVSKVTGAEHAAHNLVDIDHAGEFSSFSADPITNVYSALQAFETRGKFLMRVRWVRPTSVKFTASSHRSKELGASRRRGFFQNGMSLHAAFTRYCYIRFGCKICQLSRPVNVLLLQVFQSRLVEDENAEHTGKNKLRLNDRDSDWIDGEISSILSSLRAFSFT